MLRDRNTIFSDEPYIPLWESRISFELLDVLNYIYTDIFKVSINIFSCDTALLSVVPVVSYENVQVSKTIIISQNKNKSGIYRITNIFNGQSYVGSSSNLSKRFYDHFNLNKVTKNKEKSILYRAILKYGLESFKVEILEYCSVGDLLNREQYYLDLLLPQYNILKTAGSLKGFKHSEASIEQIRKIKKESNRKQPEEERIRQVSSLLKGESTIVINRVTGESTSFINSHGEWKLQYLLV